MTEKNSEEALTPEWVTDNIPDQTDEPVIPRQKIINGLTPSHNDKKGCAGISLRTVTGVPVIRKLRSPGDREVARQVGENRHIQYFCDVSDESLGTFVNHGSLSETRRRSGEKGIAVAESEISDMPHAADVMGGDTMLTDSAVPPADMIYPADSGLIFKAFGSPFRDGGIHRSCEKFPGFRPQPLPGIPRGPDTDSSLSDRFQP